MSSELNGNKERLGPAGRLAALFQGSAITPLLALVGLLLGLFAVLVTPKEEEPQIDVTFADVYIPFPGATPAEVESLVTTPAEQVVSQIKGIDTLYSFSQPDGALLVVVFKVGVSREQAIVDLNNQLDSHRDWLPQGIGVGQPLVKPRGIDDVPIVSLTLWSKEWQRQLGAAELTRVAHELETELKRIPGTRDIYTLGSQSAVLRVMPDPAALSAHGISWSELNQRLAAANQVGSEQAVVQDSREIKVQVGQFLQSEQEARELVVGLQGDKPVYLGDVASVVLGEETPVQRSWMGQGQASYPAVTLAIGKPPGQNAVEVAKRVEARVESLKNRLIPAGVEVTVTRDYGVTAETKSNTLIGKLIFATTAVVLLVLVSMGWREALVVGVAIVITLALTLFASWAWGFTLNRVSLFALIFSIGILVDDAIVVVENIHRHRGLGKGSLKELIPGAVDEVGGPTILATLTVIAALLPMAFVSGLMGPYMSPIPINASMGMLISLLVAFIFSPWLASHLLKSEGHVAHGEAKAGLFQRLMTPFLMGAGASRARRKLWLAILLLVAGAAAMPMVQWVVLKMLPFDNKSEFQLVLDMPEGATLEQTERTLLAVGRELAKVEEVKDYQIYAGSAAPINFNGLVRHYFIRSGANVGDIQVNLVDKHERHRSSHQIAQSVRAPLQAIASAVGGNLKVVEVPPGPPVWSPIVAEIYGPTQAAREAAARAVQTHFVATPDLVDVDIYLTDPQPKWRLVVDRSKAARFGVDLGGLVTTLNGGVGYQDASWLQGHGAKYPVPIRIELAPGDKRDLAGVLALKVRSQSGQLIRVSELVSRRDEVAPGYIMHKNMQPMVVADMGGHTDSPLYGMFAAGADISLPQYYVQQPDKLGEVALLWDGEWKVTYETFRDMGLAYGVGMTLIYLLVVAQFRSYLVPLIIMAPIPLTLIGVMPGHALLGAQFTATSMIGMIALAGIIVRNSILLVDFIEQQRASGVVFEQAVIAAAQVRAKPIMLTALAAMIGALFILDDPIFNGLAISLIFGILVSTLLTLVVIPLLYYSLMSRRAGAIAADEPGAQ
ncbi:efflux RND transporter permease subunit [Aeromonas hydrophila]|uniref:efflux RND transporter permease subunit n=1 Tax=Aeromonas hydrophila TaxID=644 RepID=UPI001D09CBF2|nr:efflux RND transporter permease subunit [Aeromonas hydrophila]MCC0183322.1 efflux RND transporter permease subunit [Aeromonas hydrophila]